MREPFDAAQRHRQSERARDKLISMKKRKPVVHIVDREDGNEDRLFWQDKSPEERLSAVEFLREQCYAIQGFKKTPRIIREIHIVDQEK